MLITSGSRLFLAMAEAKARAMGARHVYMDTNGIFVPPEYAEELVAYFQPLNPYAVDIPMLKAEKVDVTFYGSSSKWYALFRREDSRIELVDYKLHGLGHLMNPFPNSEDDWHSLIWHDILAMHFGEVSPAEIEEKYAGLYAVSRLTVSTPAVFRRFAALNEGNE